MTSEEKLDLSEVIRQAGVKLLRIAGSCEHSEADGYLLRRIGDSLCQARESLAKVTTLDQEPLKPEETL